MTTESSPDRKGSESTITANPAEIWNAGHQTFQQGIAESNQVKPTCRRPGQPQGREVRPQPRTLFPAKEVNKNKAPPPPPPHTHHMLRALMGRAPNPGRAAAKDRVGWMEPKPTLKL